MVLIEDIKAPQEYKDQIHYDRIWRAILEQEKKKQIEDVQSSRMYCDKVRWDTGSKRVNMYFTPIDNKSMDDDKSGLPTWWNFKISDAVVVRLETPTKWKCPGRIFQIYNFGANEFGVKLDIGNTVLTNITKGYSISLVWNSTIFHRMNQALRCLMETDERCSHQKYLIHALHNRLKVLKCDDYDHSDYDPPSFSFDSNIEKILRLDGIQLNDTQLKAISMGLEKRLFIMQGAPGTGKTTTLVHIVYNMLKQHKHAKRSPKIMLCAQSNLTVDLLAVKLHKLGFKVTRYFSRRYGLGTGGSPALHLGYIQQLFERDPSLRENYERFICCKLTGEPADDYRKRYQIARTELWEDTQVVCCTCVSAGCKDLQGLRFDVLMIDDAAQASELECIIPIFMRRASRLILAGDHKQLGPVVSSGTAWRAGLGVSLFERFTKQSSLKSSFIMLDVQYRMHPLLAEFPSTRFYDGWLKNGLKASERQLEFPWLGEKDASIVFVSVDGKEEKTDQETGNSRCNEMEVDYVIGLLCDILDSGVVKPENIGIISPYDAQRQLLHYKLSLKLEQDWSLSESLIRKVEISSIDAFQGRDKAVVIVTFARANEDMSDFLSNRGRLNVALTRANCKLFLVGHYDTLKQNPDYSSLLKFVARLGSVIRPTKIECIRREKK